MGKGNAFIIVSSDWSRHRSTEKMNSVEVGKIELLYAKLALG